MSAHFEFTQRFHAVTSWARFCYAHHPHWAMTNETLVIWMQQETRSVLPVHITAGGIS